MLFCARPSNPPSCGFLSRPNHPCPRHVISRNRRFENKLKVIRTFRVWHRSGGKRSICPARRCAGRCMPWREARTQGWSQAWLHSLWTDGRDKNLLPKRLASEPHGPLDRERSLTHVQDDAQVVCWGRCRKRCCGDFGFYCPGRRSEEGRGGAGRRSRRGRRGRQEAGWPRWHERPHRQRSRALQGLAGRGPSDFR